MMRIKSAARREREIEAEVDEDENEVMLDSKVSESMEIWQNHID
jgi:hypothetical protein